MNTQMTKLSLNSIYSTGNYSTPVSLSISRKSKLNLNASYSNTLSDKAYSEEKNRGGFAGAAEYLGTMAGAGFVGVFEGMYDYVVGGVADLFGADEYAEKLMKDNITGRWTQNATEKFNPGKGWKFAGDTTNAFGQVAGAMVPVAIAAAITYFSGGTLTPAAAKILSTAVIGLGAAGQSTASAYEKTGELGGKEWLYGTASGAVEAGLEYATGATGKAAKSIVSPTAGTVGKSIVRQGIVKGMFSEGAGEFVEEAISEFVDPYLQRMTGVDKNAENASLDEILYAGIIGFTSGALLAGATKTSSNFKNAVNGNKLLQSGKANTVISEAEAIRAYVTENMNQKADFVDENLRGLTASLNAYDAVADKTSLRAKMLIGEIQRGTAFLETSKGVGESYNQIISQADLISENLKKNGQNVSAEDIRQNKDGVTSALAVNDFVGKLLIDEQQYAQVIRSGEKFMGESQFSAFRNSADEKTIKRLSKELGIDVRNATYEEFNEAAKQQFRRSESQKMTDAVNSTAAEIPEKISLRNGEVKKYKTEKGNIVYVRRIGQTYVINMDMDGTEKGMTVKKVRQKDILGVISDLENKKAVYAEAVAKSESIAQAESGTDAQATQESQSTREKAAVKDSADKERKTDEFAKKTEKEKSSDNKPKDLSSKVQRDFEKQIDKWDGHTVGFSFVMCYSSEVLKKLGIYNKQIRIDATKLSRIMAEHPEMSKEVIKNIPDVIKNPVIIMDSKTISGRMVLLGDVYDEQNKLVTVVIELNPSRKIHKGVAGLDIIKIASAQGRSNTQGLINRSNIRYIDSDKNRVANWLKVNRLQLPLLSSQSNSNNSIYDLSEKSTENAKKLEKNTKTSAKKKKTFAENIKSILEMSEDEKISAEKDNAFVSVLKRTPEVILNNVKGAENLEMIIKYSSLYLAVRKNGTVKGHYHNLGEKFSEILPIALNSPDAIIRLKNGRINLFASLNGVKGFNGVISVELNTIKDVGKKNLKYNLIISAFNAKENYIRNLISEKAENIEYKKEDLAQVNPQLYEWLATVNVKSSNNSIHQSGEKSIENKEKFEKNNKNEQKADKIEDFGEHIGGARKELWKKRGLLLSDLNDMNDREAEKYVTKDNVWVRPDYVKLVSEGKDVGLLYAQNEIRKSVSPKITYLSFESAEKRAEKQRLYINTVREIQAMAENITSAEDIKKMGEQWLLDKGYIEESKSYGAKYRYTSAYYENPALRNSNYYRTLFYLARDFGQLKKIAEKAEFGVDSSKKIPKGFSIEQHTTGSEAAGEGDISGTWFISQRVAGNSHQIIGDGYASFDEALSKLKEMTKKEREKTRFVPAQLLDVHRTGYDYRNGKNVTGDDYINTFGFKGGEFGNWMSEKDRAVSMNYGYDALMDMADALKIDQKDIAFGGTLNIAFGSRGVAGAAAHYEPLRKVINLTKMNGAGTLSHEWYHAMEDYVRSSTSSFEAKKAFDNLVNTMRYKGEGPSRTRTDFFRNSITFDHMFFQSGGYWQSSEEMGARAFSCYITDKTNKQSDYLSGMSEVFVAPDNKGNMIAAIPQGEERIRINKAIDDLIATLKKEKVFSEAKETVKKPTVSYSLGERAFEKPTQKAIVVKIAEASARITARTYVEGFDMLSGNAKARISDAIISGVKNGVSKEAIKAAANLIAVRNGLNITFSGKVSANGLYYTDGNDRFAVINANNERSATKTAILHELTHDLEYEDGYEKLSATAQALIDKDEAERIRNDYIKYYKDNNIQYDEKLLKSEITAHFFSEFLNEQSFIDKYSKENSSFFVKAKNWIKNLSQILQPSQSRGFFTAKRLEIMYEHTLKQNGINLNSATNDSEAKFLLKGKNADGIEVYETSEKIKNLPIDERIDYFTSLMENEYKGRTAKFTRDGHTYYALFDKIGIEKNVYGDKESTQGGRKAKIRTGADGNIFELVENADYVGSKPEVGKQTKAHKNVISWDYFVKTVQIDGKIYNVLANVRKKPLNEYVYNIVLKESKKNRASPPMAILQSSGVKKGAQRSDGSIYENSKNVNSKFEKNEKYFLSPTKRHVLNEMPDKPKTKMYDRWTSLQIAFVDEFAGVEKVGRKLGVEDMDVKVQTARSAKSQAYNWIYGERFDIASKDKKSLGKSLMDVFEPIYKNGDDYYTDFADYLLNKHNIDRQAQGKPVFGVSADESKLIVSEYEKNYPEFAKNAKEVYAYLDDLMKYRVNTGLLTQAQAEELKKMYPFYVPTQRDVSGNIGNGSLKGKYNLAVKKTIKSAKGSTLDILRIDNQIANMTIETIKAGRVNQLANAIYDAAEQSGDFSEIEIKQSEKMKKSALANIMDEESLKPKNNEVTFFREGKKITMKVSKNVFAGFEALAPGDVSGNIIFDLVTKANSTFKKLVTSYNPAFAIRNPVRDLQDAGLYSKYPAAFTKNYFTRVQSEILKNGETWRLYRAMGGFDSAIFNFDEKPTQTQTKNGFVSLKGKNALLKPIAAIENMNSFLEQLPRFAEFMASLEAGNSAEQAYLDSADVTVNFGRTGKVTKVLNRSIMPFLNAAIQGFDKTIRTVKAAQTAGQISSLLFRAVLLGVAPMMLGNLMYKDDEDYQNLRETDKENNYLIKVGDVFVKIPRGRVLSVIAGAANRVQNSDKEDIWTGYIANVFSQATPVENMSRTIFSPFADIKNNKTWYGSAIEGRQFENIEPKQRYDESTSNIAIWLGKALNYSPKKIHYLLDQYSGVIGDFVLPATTKKAERGFLSGNFTLDPATSNELSEKFYKIYDETNYAKNSKDDTAIYQLRYLNKVKKSISNMYDEKSEIQNSDMGRKDKLAQTKVVQVLINEAYKTALQDFDAFTAAVNMTAGIDDENFRYAESIRLLYGSERALREYDSVAYENRVILKSAGIDFDYIYSLYFILKGVESDKNADGETISGSKKAKVIKAIAGTKGLTKEQKLLLIYANGYTILDGEIKGYTRQSAKLAVAKYIAGLKISVAEKQALAEYCGFAVENGKIVA